jgi:hypothetical protein
MSKNFLKIIDDTDVFIMSRARKGFSFNGRLQVKFVIHTYIVESAENRQHFSTGKHYIFKSLYIIVSTDYSTRGLEYSFPDMRHPL